MSTDQITPNRPVTLEPTQWAGRPVRLVVRQNSENMKTAIPLTLGELEAIVQAAYDQHGIIATPSYTREAEAGRARYADISEHIEDAREVSDQADYLAAHDPAQTTIEEHLELDTSKLEANLDAARAKLTGALREKLTGEVR